MNKATGLASCHVGYVPIPYFKNTSYNVFDGEYLCCDFDYRVHETAQNRHKLYCMNGLIRGKILQNNPKINWKNCLDGEAISIDQDLDLLGNVEPISNNEQKLKDYLENHPTKHKNKRKKSYIISFERNGCSRYVKF